MKRSIRAAARRAFAAAALLLTAAALLACASPAAAAAGKTVVKLATLAPKESSWHVILEQMGQEWRRVSGGAVELKIYAGTLGDESDIMRRIRIGQLDAGAVTAMGLSTVDNAALAFSIPMAIESDAELDFVRARLTPRLEKAMNDKGYIVLNWGDAGWVQFFTKEPVRTPADLRKFKIFAWASGNPLDDLWKENGYQAVSLAATDILPSLQTGMVTALPTTPLAMLANQWFPFARNMTALRWAPLTGATVISASSWEKIPAELRPALLEISRQTGLRMRDDIRRMEGEAISAMAKRGVKVVELSPDERRSWLTMALDVYPQLRGRLVDAATFDEVLRLRDEFRAGASAKTAPGKP